MIAIARIIAAVMIAVLLLSRTAGIASAEQSIRIFGYIATDADAAIKNSRVSVSYRDQNGTFSKNTQTDENGYYESIVPYRTSYDFFIEGRDYGDPYLFNYIPVKKTVFVSQPIDVRVDFKLRPAANLIIHTYDSGGVLISNKDFEVITNGEAYATGPDNLPHYAVYYPIQGTPAFVVLPQISYVIHFLWEVPEFGKIMLSADNEGNGYSVENKGGQLTLNLNYEAAKSKVAILKRDYDLLKSEGLVISSTVAEGLKQSQEHLKMAESYILQSPSTDMRAVVQESNLSLKYSLFAHEQLYLDKAKADIEKYRKGNVNIKMVDKEGKPLIGYALSFKQTRSDFIFSATPYSASYSKLLKEAGINTTTSYFKYGDVEPELGQFNWKGTDGQVDVQLRGSFASIGNLGWFFFRGWEGKPDIYFPGYLNSMSFEEVKKAVYNHVYAIASRYKDKVDVWDAIYEACPAWSNELKWTWSQRFEILKTVTSAIRTANPQSKILLKDEASPYNHYMSWSVYEPIDLNARADWVSLPEFITVANSQQIPIDIVGLAFPTGDVQVYQSGSPNIQPALDLVSVSSLLDQYAKFNKPIMLIDYHAPSTQIGGGTWWHRPWDEQTQSEYATGFYTIVFSNPLAKGIDWGAGVTDDVSGKWGGLTSGLLHADLTPKPVYFALKTLINSWTTSGTGKTNEKGGFELRGFGGDYEVNLETATGQSFKRLIHINEQQTNEVIVELPLTFQKEAKPEPSSEPVVSQSPNVTMLPAEPQPTVTPPAEEAASSEGVNIPLIAGAIGGISVLGLLTLLVIRRKLLG